MSLKLYDPLAGEESAPAAAVIEKPDDTRQQMLLEIERLKSKNRSLKAKKTWAKRIHDQNQQREETISRIEEISPPGEKDDSSENCHPKKDESIAALAKGLTSDRSFKLPEVKKDESKLGHHFTAENGNVYGDTTFISCLSGIGAEIKHMGFGDFDAVFSDGKLSLMRDDDYPLPNKNGRAHRIIASSKDILSRILKLLEEKGLSVNSTPQRKESEPIESTVNRIHCVEKQVTVELLKAPPSLPTPNPVQLTKRSSREEIMARIKAMPQAWPKWRRMQHGIFD